MTAEEQLEIIQEGTVEILDKEKLLEKLRRGKPLRVKIGFDPTAPDLHLGHIVQLQKLKDFQDLGHRIIFLVGDFTAMIGDPTGKNETRPSLSRDEVKVNAQTYIDQVGKVLDIANAEVRYNSEWSDKLKPQDIIKLMSHYNVARLLEREDFFTRYKNGQAIAIHEFFYPLSQAYDSVALEADIELGGTDQTFNLLVGRKIQKDYGQESQTVITMPLLVGTDGSKKMSKSLDNYIAVQDDPKDKFGKIMSISDDLMWDYWQILRLCSATELTRMRAAVDENQENPRDIKLSLAGKIITLIDGIEQAQLAQDAFISQFSKGNKPDDIKESTIQATEEGIPLANLMKQLNMTPSTSEALRLIDARAVAMDDKLIESNLILHKGESFLLRVGKRRYAKVKIL
ncbi:MAG: tyrosine--tRNA ligase, partial [Gammaproteobacteria bacterium]|nr:tyrosine--tRNA ligase [Gammaproteobacteria bacterium]